MIRVVGIDLGTSNTVVAWCEARAGAHPAVVSVPQWVARDRKGARPLYPSCLFCPPEAERVSDDPFGESPWLSGELARARGAEVPGRLVASAKSWLCHGAIDRSAPILPYGSDDPTVLRISPLGASTIYLKHAAWALREAGALDAGDDVVLTVPASFDDAARSLTLRAARDAELSPVLLEEPTAAFYAYLENAADLRALVAERGTVSVLVCDVGGGTTDLSLLRATKDASGLRVERTAVGRHLLLGGDNMDLALAHAIEPRLASGAKLAPAQLAQLVAACRDAKEALLGASPPEGSEIRIAQPGAKLVGGILRATLERTEAERLVLDGFFPEIAALETTARPRAGLVGFGLPFEHDAAITRHVLRFVQRHGATIDAVLLNGGVFLAERIAERLVGWLSARSDREVVRLPLADPDLAVARGAVVYGLARRGHRRAIEARSVRAYYVGVAARAETIAAQETIAADQAKAVCVLQRGAREGEEHVIAGRTFDLAVGAPVRFDLYSSESRSDAPGDVVPVSDELDRLPPLAAALDYADARRTAESVRVVLGAELAQAGLLAVRFREAGPRGPSGGNPRRFDRDFDLRPPTSASKPPPPADRRLAEAISAIERVFGKAPSAPRAAKELQPSLERILGERSSWDGPALRTMFDALTRAPGSRRRSADHERVFFALAGYFVRPGFGDPGDAARCNLLARLFAERLGFPAEPRGWQQFFIAFRRASGGLDEPTQTTLRDVLDPFVAPRSAGLATPKKLSPLAPTELLDLLAALERVPRERRAQLGDWVTESTYAEPRPHLWAAIGRIGARVPAYASVHHVVAPAAVEAWIDVLLRQAWEKLPTAPLAAVRMARLTGDRARDVSDRVRAAVQQRLIKVGAAASLVKDLSDATPREEERAETFGERLPLGLRLVDVGAD